MSVKLLITDLFHADALAKLKAELDCEFVHARELRPTAQEINLVQGLLIRSRTRVDPALLDQAPHLKWVVTATSGFDHIDFRACARRGITVAHTPQANVQSAAELTVALILNLTRLLPQVMNQLAEKTWRPDNRRGLSLDGKILGLVGLGRIGQQVARILKTFGMKIQAHDPYIEDDVFHRLEVERVGLSELLIAADVLSLHVPLTRETHHLINHQTLRLINPEALLVNTSRGPVVDENELVVALDEGLIKGAALDVFEREPLPQDSRLRGRPNVLLTPHVGAFTEEALEKASIQAVERTIDFFKSGRALDMLPLETPWFSLVP